jgi:hypothetical protein
MSTDVESFRSIAAAFGLAVAVTACAGLPETAEHMMASSGFKTMSVTTPAQKAAFAKFPQGQFAKKVDNGKTLWIYRADPTICTCLYVGDQQAYSTFLKKAAAKPPIQDAIQGGSTMQDEGDYSPWAQNYSPYAL